MNSPDHPPPARRVRLALTVQRASRADSLPAAADVRRWVRAALMRPAEMTVRLVDEAEARRLNRDFRGRDYATNVLTFVYRDEPLAGDIVLCAPVVAREAAEHGIARQARYAHLVVHGVLHLQGFDHENDRDAEAMERLEARILADLGFADPYPSFDDHE
jgi:probable rRNA maturation factor